MALPSPLGGPLSQQARISRLRSSVLDMEGEPDFQVFGKDVLDESSRHADLVVPKKRMSNQPKTFMNAREGERGSALEKKNTFLKETVHRLNVELSRYQTRRPDLNPDDSSVNKLLGINKDDPVAPWLSNAEQLAPLLTAYDERLTEAQEKLKYYENELSNVKSKCEVIVKENNTLRKELEKNVELLLDHSQGRFGTQLGNYDGIGISVEEREELVEQVHLLTKENDLLVDQQSATQLELDRVREDLGTKSKELYAALQQDAVLQSDVETLKEELGNQKSHRSKLETELQKKSNMLKTLKGENATISDDMIRMTKSLQSVQETNADYKRNLQQVTSKYQAHVTESSVMAEREADLMRTLKAKEMALEDMKLKHNHMSNEYGLIQEKFSEILSTTQNLQKRISESETKELENYRTMQSHIAAVEEARLERDKCLAREEQNQKEIERLSEKVLSLPQRYKEKMETEISTLRSQFLNDKRKLTEEIGRLEILVADMQSHMERAIREKRSAELELEKSTQHIPLESERFTVTIEELNSKLRISERERDDATFKLESLHSKFSREENRHEKERYELASKLEEMYRRVRRTERDFEESKEERLSMLAKITEIQTEYKNVVEERDKLVREHSAEMVTVSRKADAEIKQLSAKFEELSETHMRVTRELQQILAEQQRVGSRWKEETKSTAEKCEASISEAHAQLRKALQRADELSENLAKALAVKSELIGQLTEEKNAQTRLHSLLHHADLRAKLAGKQVQESQAREADLNHEKRKLQRDFDRLTLEREKLERERGHSLRRDMETATARRESSGINYVGEEEIRNLQSDIDRLTRPRSVTVTGRLAAGDE